MDAELVALGPVLALSDRQPDALIDLEWRVAAAVEARLGRELFVAVGDPPRPIEKFRLLEYPDEEEIVTCTDSGDKPSCTCDGVVSCKSKRWARVCAPNTEDCGNFSCSCTWSAPST